MQKKLKPTTSFITVVTKKHNLVMLFYSFILSLYEIDDFTTIISIL